MVTWQLLYISLLVGYRLPVILAKQSHEDLGSLLGFLFGLSLLQPGLVAAFTASSASSAFLLIASLHGHGVLLGEAGFETSLAV